MSIKINEKVLSIPPYISTSWSCISAMHMKESFLVITLNDNHTIAIPELPADIITSAFDYHTAYLEAVNLGIPAKQPLQSLERHEQFNQLMEQGGAALRLGFGSLDGLNNAMQHNPEQANAPALPPEILQKISAISKILATDEIALPQAEPNCNCFHCQIAQALNPSLSEPLIEDADAPIPDEDLSFQQWSITQTDEKLFSVVNCLDEKEKYNVYLGEPLGCTCGTQGCEHIVAVLKS
jgi:hypothetical protein